MATAWTQLETGVTTSWLKNRGHPASVLEISKMTHAGAHFPQISENVEGNTPTIASFVAGGGTAWTKIEAAVTTTWTQIEKG